MVGMGVFTSLDRFRNGLSLLGFCGISCVIGNQSIPPITVEGRCSGFRLVPNVERLGGVRIEIAICDIVQFLPL